MREAIYFGLSLMLAVASSANIAKALRLRLGRPAAIWVGAMLSPLFLNVAFWLFFELKNWLADPAQILLYYFTLAATLGIPFVTLVVLKAWLPRDQSAQK